MLDEVQKPVVLENDYAKIYYSNAIKINSKRIAMNSAKASSEWQRWLHMEFLTKKN